MTPSTIILAVVLSQPDISIRDYVDLRFAEMKQAVDAALASQERLATSERLASQKAIDKAEALAADNKADANEWRGAFSDREAAFVTRVELYSMVATAMAMVGAAFVIANWNRGQKWKSDA